jgi:chaperonin GroEL (HSP60 family)
MSKIIEFGPEARKQLVNGIDKLADAVVSTL